MLKSNSNHELSFNKQNVLVLGEYLKKKKQYDKNHLDTKNNFHPFETDLNENYK